MNVRYIPFNKQGTDALKDTDAFKTQTGTLFQVVQVINYNFTKYPSFGGTGKLEMPLKSCQTLM